MSDNSSSNQWRRNEQLRWGARLIERASSLSLFATARSTPDPCQASMGCRSQGADMMQSARPSRLPRYRMGPLLSSRSPVFIPTFLSRFRVWLLQGSSS